MVGRDENASGTPKSRHKPAERLDVSRRTVERYRAEKLTAPQKRLQAALMEENESERLGHHTEPEAA